MDAPAAPRAGTDSADLGARGHIPAPPAQPRRIDDLAYWMADKALRTGWGAHTTAVNAIRFWSKRPKDLHELIATTPKTGLRVAVIGTGISGVQSIKCCLAEGIEPVAFEADSDIGGFWRYKEDAKHPSVYRSTHIDIDRDQVSFGDYPVHASQPLLLHNTHITKYLRENVRVFGLNKYIQFNTRVTWITPDGAPGRNRWAVTTERAGKQETHIFDGVMVCTGRHGGGGYVPKFPGLDRYRGQWLHSSQYKYPEKHGLLGKRVAVVGIGNSGGDIVTELGPALAKTGGKTVLVARSGGWVVKCPHGEELWSGLNGDRVYMDLYYRRPWWVMNDRSEAANRRGQEVLNRHGMKPKHRLLQQHTIFSGLAGQTPLQDQLEKGWIVAKRGIRSFTENGAYLGDDVEETALDAVVFATGYRHVADFIDPKVLDLRFDRPGNDVPLFKGCLAISEYTGLGMINFVQSNTFMCAEMQGRVYTRVLKGLVKLPSLSEQRQEMESIRNSLAAQYLDRQQLRVQHGVSAMYYDDLARFIGVFPSFWKLAAERPSALWHGMFAVWQPLQFRLVGPGSFENAEKEIEDRYYTRHYGEFLCDSNPKKGQAKKGNPNREKPLWWSRNARAWRTLAEGVWSDYRSGLNVGNRIQDHMKDNVEFAKRDDVEHSLALGQEPKDGWFTDDSSDKHKRISAFGKSKL
eukprot:TRINITY_DN9910_c0_g2_i1.p1 TRINITY_DN9910_c0_g2~~TRINITY_DN9910_c0_g2_i1.p1  ORF type:complete len:757 (+),score=124.91 TRINITY_DN9910_c0_g2_i1:206-2272(+)